MTSCQAANAFMSTQQCRLLESQYAGTELGGKRTINAANE